MENPSKISIRWCIVFAILGIFSGALALMIPGLFARSVSLPLLMLIKLSILVMLPTVLIGLCLRVFKSISKKRVSICLSFWAITFFLFIYIARPQAYYRRIFGHPLPEGVSIEHVALYDAGPDWCLFMKLQSPNKSVEKIIQQSNGKQLELKITDGEIYFDNNNKSIVYTPPAKKWWSEMNIKETQIYDISNNESETTIIMWDKKNKMVYCQCFS